MNKEKELVKQNFQSIENSIEEISHKLEEDIKESFKDVSRIDKISFRVKSLDSFLKKCEKKLSDKSEKYKIPFKEIQDIIGGRIVVYYKGNFLDVIDIIEQTYERVEKRELVQCHRNNLTIL